MAWARGERRVCSMVRAPSPEDGGSPAPDARARHAGQGTHSAYQSDPGAAQRPGRPGLRSASARLFGAARSAADRRRPSSAADAEGGNGLAADWRPVPGRAGPSSGIRASPRRAITACPNPDRACLVVAASSAQLGVEPLVSGAGRRRQRTNPPDRHRGPGPQAPGRLVALCHPGRRSRGGMTRWLNPLQRRLNPPRRWLTLSTHSSEAEYWLRRIRAGGDRCFPLAETCRSTGWSRQPEPDALEHEG
jgi:hypothetical protein